MNQEKDKVNEKEICSLREIQTLISTILIFIWDNTIKFSINSYWHYSAGLNVSFQNNAKKPKKPLKWSDIWLFLWQNTQLTKKYGRISGI